MTEANISIHCSYNYAVLSVIRLLYTPDCQVAEAFMIKIVSVDDEGRGISTNQPKSLIELMKVCCSVPDFSVRV